MKEDQKPLIGDFAEEAYSPEVDGQGLSVEESKHKGFSSKIGFVLAAAGSAVGLGNLWRFPYLAAQYGGGIFLVCYIALAVTFGFCLLMLEIAIGRKTGKGVVGAFSALNRKFKWFGFVCLVVPIIIVPYYSVIGGWVLRYVFAYITGDVLLTGGAADAATSAQFFNAFTASPWQPILFFLLFAAFTICVVIFGVQKGIERISKILMPLLAILAVFLMVYVLCQPGAMVGVRKLFIPDFSEFKFETVLAALGQLFYSMSLAMCIMITYGSYMKKSASIPKSARQISICDTAFAIVAAVIIIPSIFAFASDPDTVLKSYGPSLMFVQLPAVFHNIPGGQWMGLLFFILVFFAALTSSISLVEAIVNVLRDSCKMKRWQACCAVFGIMIVLGTLSSLGFGPLQGIRLLGKDILSFFDFIANNIIMPLVAIVTCIIAGYFVQPKIILEEIGLRKTVSQQYFTIMIRYIAPICIFAILISGIFLTI